MMRLILLALLIATPSIVHAQAPLLGSIITEQGTTGTGQTLVDLTTTTDPNTTRVFVQSSEGGVLVPRTCASGAVLGWQAAVPAIAPTLTETPGGACAKYQYDWRKLPLGKDTSCLMTYNVWSNGSGLPAPGIFVCSKTIATPTSRIECRQ